MTLSQRIDRLEAFASTGRLAGRDLEVIQTQVARAEAKLLTVAQTCSWTRSSLGLVKIIDP